MKTASIHNPKSFNFCSVLKPQNTEKYDQKTKNGPKKSKQIQDSRNPRNQKIVPIKQINVQ